MDDPRIPVAAVLIVLGIVFSAVVVAISGAWGFLKRLIFGKETKASAAAKNIRFITRCDHCSTEVPMVNESLIGYWHPCPSCGNQFRVQKLRSATPNDRKTAARRKRGPRN